MEVFLILETNDNGHWPAPLKCNGKCLAFRVREDAENYIRQHRDDDDTRPKFEIAVVQVEA